MNLQRIKVDSLLVRKSILFVSTDAHVRSVYSLLIGHGNRIDVHCCETLEEMNVILGSRNIDLTFIDGDCYADLPALVQASSIRYCVPALVWSGTANFAVFKKLVESGAIGYLTKDQPATDVVAAVRDGLSGGNPLSPQISKMIIQSMQPPSHPGLTKRELEVLHLLQRGYTYKGVSERLEISLDTVKTHLHHIYDKLGVATKSEAIRKTEK